MSVSHRDEIDYGPNPEERVRLECGECGKQILTREMTLTGEGVRCQECMAKLDARYAAFKAGQNGQQAPQPEQVTSGSVWPEAGQQAYAADSNPPPGKPPVIEINVDTTFCKRHPKVETGLKCGRCGTPICPRCMVYTPVGVRCPDCAHTPIRTVGVETERAAAAAAQRDTGFRTYWKRTTPQYAATSGQLLFKAGLAALGVAIVGALVWGFLLNASVLRGSGAVEGSLWFQNSTGTGGLNNLASGIQRSFVSSIQLFPEIFLAIAVSEAISRVTGDRRGRPLQFIAMGAVLLGIFLTFVVLGARIYATYSNGFPPPGNLLGSALSAFGYMFQGNNLAIPIFWVVGLVFAWMRLNR